MKSACFVPIPRFLCTFFWSIAKSVVYNIIILLCCTLMTQFVVFMFGAIFQGVPPLDVRIKWPNDLYIDGVKVGGVLCTSTYRSKKFNISAGKYSLL